MNLFGNILAARGRDFDKFLPLLIVAVVIVVNIIKVIARGVKSLSQQGGLENKSVRPQKPSRYIDTPDDFKTMEQLREEKIAQIRATFGIPSPQTEEEFEEPEKELYVAPAPPPMPKKYIQKPQPRRVSATVSQPEMTPLAKHYEQPKHSTAKHKQSSSSSKPQTLTPINAVFSSADDLRKAVLYQEILGKPVALRD